MDKNNQEDRFRFAAIMKTWEINFSAKMGDNDDERAAVIRLYFDAFSEFSIEQVEGAAKQVLRNRKYKQLPTIAEVVEHICGRQPTAEQKADYQWGLILEKVSECGAYTMPTFSDPITTELFRRRFSWGELCMTLTSQSLDWKRKQFIEAYAATVECDPVLLSCGQAKMAQLAGGVTKLIE